MRSCPNCGNQVSDTAVFCDQCGTKLPAEEPVVEEAVVEQVVVEEPAGGLPEGIVICPACGAENVPGEIFCDVCGQELETPQPVQAAVEEAVVEPVVEEVIVEEEPVVEEIVVEEEPVLEEAVIDPEDRDLFWFAETAEEIWSDIVRWYERAGRKLAE